MRYAHIIIGLALFTACATTAPATTHTTPTRATAAETPRRFDMVGWMRNRERGTPPPAAQPSLQTAPPIATFTWAETTTVDITIIERVPPRRPAAPTRRPPHNPRVCDGRMCVWYGLGLGPWPSLMSPGPLRLWNENVALIADSYWSPQITTH